MKIGTWNVRGVTDKLAEVTQEIKTYNLDIVVLSETKKKGCGNEDIDEYIHFWSGVEKSKRASSGVSILIKKQLKKFVKDYKFVTDRILSITLKMFGYGLTIIGVYAPIDNADKQVKDDFYKQLLNELNNIKNRQDIVIAGDLNGRVNSQEQNEVVGKYAEEVENDNGERLLELCNQYELKLTNTFFEHKDIHRYTWERPSLQQKTIIDYIITRQRTTFKVNDVRVKRGANCGTDHHLLVATMVYPFSQLNYRREVTTSTRKIQTQRYNLDLLQQESIRDLYERRLQRELKNRTRTQVVEEEYTAIKNIIQKIARETLGEYKKTNKKKQPAWFTQTIKELIVEKNKLYKKFLAHKSEETKHKYREKNVELRKQIKTEKNKFWEQKCLQINTYIGGAQSTEVWKTIKNIKTNQKTNSIQLIGTSQWKTYYQSLLTETREAFVDNDIHIENEEEPTLITVNEVVKNIKEMKNNRSPGPGDIYAELLKCGGNQLWDDITNLMNQCILQQKIPREWKICYISSVHKKGNRKDPSNYRGLSVTSTFSRLWGKIIQKRVRQEVGNKIGEDQTGFTPGRSCTDNLFTIQQLIEKKITKGDEIHITFIDLKKAYDNVPRNKLWEALKTIGVSNYLIRNIQELYKDNVSYVKQQNVLSQPINTTKGLRQGCSLSPLLFNIYVEIALKNWKRACKGMGIPINRSHLFTLNFADDQAILAQDAFDMEFMLRRLYQEYKKWGLEISLEKTEYLVMNSDAQFEILINDDTCIRQVDKFKYLGTIVDKDGIGKQEIKQRIQNARKIVGSLNSVWWDKNISKNNKKRIGQTMVETVLCYGSEVWVLKEDDKRRITAVEMDYLRRSARKSRLEHIRNEEIRRTMNATETVLDRIEKRSLKWFGHLLRMDENRWPKRVFTWKPEGKNKKGRPRRSWNDGIRKAMRDRDLEENMAYERDTWRLGLGRQPMVV